MQCRYHLKDVIVGKIYFLLVRIKIKHMELSIIRRETTGSPPNQYNESETITKFEIMDGAPVRGSFVSCPHFQIHDHLVSQEKLFQSDCF
jgi:vacuolar protein sorting-associated protein 26